MMTRHDLVVHLKYSKFQICMPQILWENFDHKYDYIKDDKKWNSFKFIDNDGSLNRDIEKVDKCKGGIYCFYISPEIIPTAQHILVYIGRAMITDVQNLRKRIKEYYAYIMHNDNDLRPAIEDLFSEYKEYLYCKYIEIENNNEIVDLEKCLINSLLPPANARIPDAHISAAVRAAF